MDRPVRIKVEERKHPSIGKLARALLRLLEQQRADKDAEPAKRKAS